jgi:hypothetical protein
MVRTRVMNIYRANTHLKVTQLRLGRLVAEEQKGRLDDKTELEIIEMMGPSPEQDKLDKQEMGQIKERQKSNAK